MKTRDTLPVDEADRRFPDEAELAAVRSWYAGLDARTAVARYLGDRRSAGASSRSVLGRIRRRLVAYAQTRHREDLASDFVDHPTKASADRVACAIETLRNLPVPAPTIADPVGLWLPARIAAALHTHGIRTLNSHIARRCWAAVPASSPAGRHRSTGCVWIVLNRTAVISSSCRRSFSE